MFPRAFHDAWVQCESLVLEDAVICNRGPRVVLCVQIIILAKCFRSSFFLRAGVRVRTHESTIYNNADGSFTMLFTSLLIVHAAHSRHFRFQC